jgi:hypothetical protein
MDFTGGNRDLGHPIMHFIRQRRDGRRATTASTSMAPTPGLSTISSSISTATTARRTPRAVSGGNYDLRRRRPWRHWNRDSEITIIGNLFYDCDQADRRQAGQLLYV